MDPRENKNQREAIVKTQIVNARLQQRVPNLKKFIHSVDRGVTPNSQRSWNATP